MTNSFKPLSNLAAMVATVVTLALPAHAARPSQAERLQIAATGAAICAQAMPDQKATEAALLANGFEFEQSNGEAKAYSAGDRRVIVIITSRFAQANACLVGVSRMTEAQALALIQPWIKAANAEPIPPRPDLEHAWNGEFKGGPIQLAVETAADLYYFRGAAIIARAPR